MRTRGSRSSCTACACSENAPEIIACDAMTVAAVASSDHERQRRRRHEHDRTDAGTASPAREQQRALTEVIQQQRGPHEREPCEPHRLLAEVAHVGVQRLAAGDREEHRAEDRERDAADACASSATP